MNGLNSGQTKMKGLGEPDQILRAFRIRTNLH